MFNLTDKVVIIAGGRGLIGAALVKGFKEHGAKVIIASTHSTPPVDMADITNVRVLSDLGPDVFINATYPKFFHDHFDAFLFGTSVMAQGMAERGGGSIINYASIYGLVSYDPRSYAGTDMYKPEEWTTNCSPYHGDCAVKAAIVQMTRVMAVEYAKKGVRVNCIAPGGVFDGQPESFVKHYCGRVPMGRMAVPEDMVGPTLFLASDASRYMTGQCLVVDGGLTCW